MELLPYLRHGICQLFLDCAMNTTERAAILEELEQHANILPDLGPGEITANDIAAKYKMTRNRAIRWARVMVKERKLEEHKRYDTRISKVVNAWRPVEIVPDAEDYDDINRVDPSEMRPPDEEGDIYY